MRIPTTSVLLILPVLGMAAEGEGPFAQYRAQFQNFIGSVGAYIQVPTPLSAKVAEASSGDAAADQAVKPASVNTVARPTEYLKLDDWKDILYSRVKPDATAPEEWWVLVTGGNKTCFGHCDVIMSAFNEAAPKLSVILDSPHTAVLDCEDQSVLCNSWSANPGYLYVFELLPQPAKTDIYTKRLNLTTTTSNTIQELYEGHSKEGFELLDSYFHPLDGALATYGIAVPVGYVLWVFGVVPSWMMMLLISFGSRTIINVLLGISAQAGTDGVAVKQTTMNSLSIDIRGNRINDSIALALQVAIECAHLR
ncbi:peptidyl-tRNA hydrolase [Grosmannia clavigera kw1407]|uniref:Peptidyl-tRNA hydrolase n=1 Tax=Grosmannia clavigera (strain kw1407 / UAMH 11150) TaxID=655863 RepID=F0XRT1_GROCL|nr:peptidyl-tRNA hydrolase [Grosmannia clavigera kw1407]EFW99445.1 peptidyl-tRNA hydrolase [Grosmannia clavigera kw1407]